MSADNYHHILKTDDGRYVVECRFASSYYADEGDSVESVQAAYDTDYGERAYVVDESWIIPAGPPRGPVFDTLEDAKAYAFSEYSEYGVSYGFPVKHRTVEVEEE